MYKLRHIYICDHCGKISLPDNYEGCKFLPSGWRSIGCKLHLCATCYSAYVQLMHDNKDLRE